MTKKQSERLARLMPNDIPRYVRIYDSGIADRYTAVFTGNYSGKVRGWCQYVVMNEIPYHPLYGVCQHGEHSKIIDIDKWGFPPNYGKSNHLGLRIKFQDLPKDCQEIVLSDYKELWNLEQN